MMYNNKVAAAIKVNGKVLREFKDTVLIPFGSEYTILIKNLNSRRGIFNIFIDGTNVVPNGLVLNAGQEIDLERSIVNNNLNVGNRFKFIERTGDIEQHRGIKLEDGLIRIEYQFEREYPKPSYPVMGGSWHYNPITGQPYWGTDQLLRTYTSNSAGSNQVKGMGSAGGMSIDSMMVGTAAVNDISVQSFNANVQNDAGITVPGSKSEQKFRTVSDFPLEAEKHTMIIKLLGETESNRPVVAPVTVKHKPKCVTCGKQNKATANFCSACGTALEIFV